MKKILPLLPLVLLLASCTNAIYHVSSVRSEQVKLMGNDFAFENEHLKGIYNLWEPGGRMRFLLFNKTDQPIYIDWSKSFLMRNSSKTYYTQLPVLSGKTLKDTVRYTYQSTYIEPYRLTARSGPFAEIPPKTIVAIADFPIQQVVLHKKTKEKLFLFSQENSPLRFGQELHYSFNPNLTDSQQTEHSFWVDKIQVVRYEQLTKLYGSLRKGQPNALYAVEQRPADGKTLAVVVVAIAAGTGAFMLLLQEMFSGITIGL